MKYYRILTVCLAAAMTLEGCVRSDFDERRRSDLAAPDGYVSFEPELVLASEKRYLTRAEDNIFNRLDDIHLLIFDGTNAVEQPDGSFLPRNDAPVVAARNYYEYGVRQKVFLRRGENYFVFVLANLDDRYCPTGDIASFLAQVETYADLKDMYVQAINYSADDVGKMMMSSDNVVHISLDGVGEVYAPTILLHRLWSQFVVTVYNKVRSAADPTVTSGVYPSTMSFMNVPRYSYVMERPVDDGADIHDKAYPLDEDGYYESTTNYMPAPSEAEQITVMTKNGPQTNSYTKQTITFYTMENRRGKVSQEDFDNYQADPGDGNPVDVPNVYARRALAPRLSTYLRLSSLTDSEVLHTYVHAGKGRDAEMTPDTAEDDITDYNVDRCCVYYFNVYINGIEDVTVDSRREYLSQVILINHSDDFDYLDAHFMDVPVFIEGRADGYVKMEAGVGEGAEWRPMSELPEQERWLTFSWSDPYPGDANVLGTTLYSPMMAGGGTIDAMPILHLDEYVNTAATGSYPAGARTAMIPASDPPRRTAVVKVGFVEGANSEAGYEQGVVDGKGSTFYFEVSQYGLHTIGQVGGWAEMDDREDGIGYYGALLGIESVEEYRHRFYLQGANPDVTRTGLQWRYIDGPGAGLAENRYPYDGLGATLYRYGEYRDPYPGAIPPVRGQQSLNPAGVYNPYSNTNAVDYCVRKNRDTDGNGVIEGDEIKWYMPTPAQTLQIYAWREAFRGGDWTLNRNYTPFSATTPHYWTTTEHVTGPDPNAYVVDFSQGFATVIPMDKNSSRAVRCVRDIPGQIGDLFYYYEDAQGNGHIAGNMTGHFPPSMIIDGKADLSFNDLRTPANNTLGRGFAVSRWYGTSLSHPDVPLTARGDEKECGGYSEPGLTSGWVLPSQEELSLIYAYAGVIENIFTFQYGDPGSSTYHRFTLGEHWAMTNIGSNSTFWRVNFTTGAATLLDKQNTAYFRCIHYFDSNNIPPKPAS